MQYATKDKIKVFLSDTSNDVEREHRLLKRVLSKAGMEVFASNGDPNRQLDEANCSIHLLGRIYEEEQTIRSKSLSEYQFQLAQQRQTPNNDFKIFVWQPWQESSLSDNRQFEFINKVQHSILQNMVFSKQESPVMFVEDLRAMMATENTSKQITNDTDVFFIYNELDEDAGKGIADLLADVVRVESLSLTMDTGTNYSDLVVQQIQRSKLAVIYYEKTADWAIPFVQQVWRKIGGASSDVEILLVGDANVPANHNCTFEAPKVHPMVIGKELVPLEIKVQFDKIVAAR